MSEPKVCKQPYLHHKSLTQDGCSVCRMEERVAELNSKEEELRELADNFTEEWEKRAKMPTYSMSEFSYGFRNGTLEALSYCEQELIKILDAK